MITFVVNSDNEKLKDAARLAQNFFKQLNITDLPESFTHCEQSREEVYGAIIEAALCLPDRFVIVETTKLWAWSKVIGYTVPSRPNYVFINSNMLGKLELADYVGNFVHEFMHIIGFKHKGNYQNRFRNLESVPYVMGSLAEAWVRGIEFHKTKQLEIEL